MKVDDDDNEDKDLDIDLNDLSMAQPSQTPEGQSAFGTQAWFPPGGEEDSECL
jgi:hypothetical protein